MYISITGLTLKSGIRPKLLFLWHSLRSFNQAKKSIGNISVSAKKINNVYHTLSVWETEGDMRKYLYIGCHKRAIQSFRSTANGRTFGFESDNIPLWDEVHKLYLEKGKQY